MLTVLLAAAVAAACSSASPPPVIVPGGGPTPAELARADSGRPPYTAADVAFMQGMIAHHAQALVMTALAPPRAVRGDVKILAERIDVAQRDEIAFMQQWLRERGEPVPAVPAVPAPGAAAGTAPGAGAHAHHGGAHGALMPGMLSAEQLAQLTAATGAPFDSLFLTFMIQHHEGALVMVDQLFATPGAGQDVNVFRFASDVTADQATEIERMRAMLGAATAQSPRGDR